MFGPGIVRQQISVVEARPCVVLCYGGPRKPQQSHCVFVVSHWPLLEITEDAAVTQSHLLAWRGRTNKQDFFDKIPSHVPCKRGQSRYTRGLAAITLLLIDGHEK